MAGKRAWVSPELSGAVFHEPRPGSLLEGGLSHPDPSLLSGEQARATLAEIDRVRSFLASLEALAVERIRGACENEARRVAEQGSGKGPVRFDGALAHALAVSEVAVAEGISEYAAARLVRASERLCGPQLTVLERLEGGMLSEAHARVLVDEAEALPDAAAEAFGVQALTRLHTRSGRRRTAGEFRRAIRSLRERLHPESIRVRRTKAVADRYVAFRPEPDGMCSLTALLPAEVGLAAFTRLDVLARAQQRSYPDEGRTLPQLRADALAGMMLSPSPPAAVCAGAVGASDGSAGAASAGAACAGAVGASDGSAGAACAGAASAAAGPGGQAVVSTPVPEPSPPAAEVIVMISADSLLGVSEDPAELEGYGPIDAGTARELAAAASTWQRLSVGDDGVPLTLGRTAYRPSKGLRRFVEYRDGTCQFPGCSRPARTCEVDHLVEWQDGGPTDAANLQSLCRRHHALKSVGSWRPQRVRPEGGESDPAGKGEVLWTSPLGGQALAGPLERDLPSSQPTRQQIRRGSQRLAAADSDPPLGAVPDPRLGAVPDPPLGAVPDPPF